VASETFDYIIIGTGAAGLHLALAMAGDPFFLNRKVLLIDKDSKKENDRTWCYWETGSGNWDSIAHKVWKSGKFITPGKEKELELDPYKYKMVRGIDFYNLAFDVLLKLPNFTFIQQEVHGINVNGDTEVVCGDKLYHAGHVFDSRIDMEFYRSGDKSIRVLQHFKGWVIETPSDVFDENRFTMMDFRTDAKDKTAFMYVLPSNPRQALVEYTFFTPDLVDDEVYDEGLKNYISKVLNVSKYKILETEKGVIPMTDYPFHKHNTSKITKIGTAGAWVKPSSGYSFKNAERNAKKVIENIKSNRLPSRGIGKGRFRKYDTLFLDILQNRNELGREIFSAMYYNNRTSLIFEFLDEETSIPEDIRIISSFQPAPFREALKRHWRSFLF